LTVTFSNQDLAFFRTCCQERWKSG